MLKVSPVNFSNSKKKKERIGVPATTTLLNIYLQKPSIYGAYQTSYLMFPNAALCSARICFLKSIKLT